MINIKKALLYALVGVLFITNIQSSSALVADPNPSGSAAYCLRLNNNVGYRSTDAQTNGEVSDLQDFLNVNGYLSVQPTGYYGLLTVSAVTRFQSVANGFSSPSGFVGPYTRAKISDITCASTYSPSTPTTTPPVTVRTTPSNDLAALQAQINALLLAINNLKPGTQPSTNPAPVNTSTALIPSDSFVNFSVAQGSANPQPYLLHFTNSSSASVNYTISVPNQPLWLNTSYATETLPLNAYGTTGVGVSVDATKVSGAGKYSTNLVLSGNFSNSPISIPVTLTVAASSQPSVTIISPNGGENWLAGSTHDITWQYSGPSNTTVNIQLVLGDAGAFYIANNVSANLQRYSWTIPSNTASSPYYRIAIRDTAHPNDWLDFSNNEFIISSSSITVTSPMYSGNTHAKRGQMFHVTWKETNVQYVDIWLQTISDNGVPSVQLASHINASNGYYQQDGSYSGYTDVQIPSSTPIRNDYVITVRSSSDSTVQSKSSTIFVDDSDVG